MKENIKMLLKSKSTYGIIGAMTLYILLITISGIGCPIKWFTGISCPGCGMSRSAMYLLQFEFAKAFEYHALTIFAIPAFLYMVLGKKPLLGSIKKDKIFHTIFISVFLAYYIIRLLIVQNDIVIVDIEQSFMVKLIKIIKELLVWFNREIF